jgi:hypothetical protein
MIEPCYPGPFFLLPTYISLLQLLHVEWRHLVFKESDGESLDARQLLLQHGQLLLHLDNTRTHQCNDANVIARETENTKYDILITILQ